MGKNIVDLRKKVKELQFEYGLIQDIECSNDESKEYLRMIKDGEKLPEEVYEYKDAGGNSLNTFYKIYKSDLSKEEKTEYILLKQTESIDTIKKCVLFLTILIIISMSFSLLLGVFLS